MRVTAIALTSILCIGITLLVLVESAKYFWFANTYLPDHPNLTGKIIESNKVGVFPLTVCFADFLDSHAVFLFVSPDTSITEENGASISISNLKPNDMVIVAGPYSNNGQFISAKTIVRSTTENARRTAPLIQCKK
jgi:hypothetical protein